MQKGTVLILKVKDLEKSDSEVYTCDVGSTKNTAKLTVKGKNLAFSEKQTTLDRNLSFWVFIAMYYP